MKPQVPEYLLPTRVAQMEFFTPGLAFVGQQVTDSSSLSLWLSISVTVPFQ